MVNQRQSGPMIYIYYSWQCTTVKMTLAASLACLFIHGQKLAPAALSVPAPMAYLLF